jgi:hypothetical protein
MCERKRASHLINSTDNGWAYSGCLECLFQKAIKICGDYNAYEPLSDQPRNRFVRGRWYLCALISFLSVGSKYCFKMP